MSAGSQFNAKKAGATADIERVESADCREHHIENAVPGGALGRGAYAMAEILIEMRRPLVPMSRDQLFDGVGLCGGH
jgi:hypothetical protein